MQLIEKIGMKSVVKESKLISVYSLLASVFKNRNLWCQCLGHFFHNQEVSSLNTLLKVGIAIN